MLQVLSVNSELIRAVLNDRYKVTSPLWTMSVTVGVVVLVFSHPNTSNSAYQATRGEQHNQLIETVLRVRAASLIL